MKVKSKGGRPREFDPEAALDAATSVFWRHSYSGAPVDQVVSAMGMSKPSVYAAFGSKIDVYCKALDAFCEGLLTAINNAAESDQPIKPKLIRLLNQEIDFYCQENPPRGCFLFCTAPAETANDPRILKKLAAMIKQIDSGFERLIERAKERGELPQDSDANTLAVSLQAMLQTIAIRARAGESNKSLKSSVKKYVECLI